MNKIEKIVKWFDRYQQKHKFFGFPIAVLKKYGDDRAGNHAALITYFGFVSLFPLLLVLFTTLHRVTNNNKSIEDRVVNAILHYFPGATSEITQNVHSLHQTGFELFIVILITIYGARGIASALQNTSNTLWQIPEKEWPNFWSTTARSFGIIILGGGGMLITTLILSYTNNISSKGPLFRILITLFTLVLNILVFSLVFRLATSKQIKTKWLISGAIVAAVFWQILQAVGSYLILHQLKRTTALYGIFAIVLGMLFWIYLQAEVTLYAIEINVVRIKKLWPKKIVEE